MTTIACNCTNPPNPSQNEIKEKTITEKFTESMERVQMHRQLNKEKKAGAYQTANKWLEPVGAYTPRFAYNGYLKKSHWRFFDKETQITDKKSELADEVPEVVLRYQKRIRKKFCLLMAFAGSDYYGMQFNEAVPTIEQFLFDAMFKNEWILEEHVTKPWLIEFQRGSRTDRGVSAARQICSLILRKILYLIFFIFSKIN